MRKCEGSRAACAAENFPITNLRERRQNCIRGGRMLADLRDAMRQLQKAPGFTTTALITLALGIGATTAIFTLVHQVMLKSLPVVKPGELWRVRDKGRCCHRGRLYPGDVRDIS